MPNLNKLIGDIANEISSYSPYAPLFTLLAGIITSFLPCTLATIPIIITYLNNGTKDLTIKKSLKLTSVLTLGMIVISTALGIVIASTTNLIQIILYSNWVFLTLGVLAILMGLQTLGIINLIPSTYLTSKVQRKGYLGAFLVGVVTGIFSSPCSTPVLIVLLSMVATTESFLKGTMYLALYGLGHGLVFIILGVFMALGKRTSIQNKTYLISIRILNFLLALGMFILGIYLLYKGV